ncbi:pyridoxine kinase [Rhodobium orientis]|uniref:pyridoxal kinase n=1 Tax=Rhodobium orientis TaxID=34017 RepID=A0A327K0H0_9HYPH|nr:pyridoxal kinase [Rhodobium orientis]MBB4304334.1 pyridoxine kinase [Rhodobium orientis]MBK5948172.1 pyridoxal kinase [Rhodobium orientis]RAI28868.1 pyridoxal kinase [Rhodobium orientis]
MLLAPKKPAIVVINSLVSRGAVGGRGALFALQRFGFPVWFVPTVVLPWHPGHGPATRFSPPMRDFAAILDDLASSDYLGEVGAVLSGYLGDAEQAEAISCFLAIAREKNPDLKYLCDPIAGDRGALYVPELVAEALKEKLLPVADIATPNLFELGWFTDTTPGTADEAVLAARGLGPAQVLVSSIPGYLRGGIGNLLVTGTEAIMAEHTVVPEAPHGPGDLLAALFLAHIVDGRDREAALSRAAAAVYELVSRSVKRGDDELAIAAEQIALDKPMAMVTMRRIGAKAANG